MWLLLVAAGTGYLARCWQNGHKAKPVTSGCGQNPRTSPPSSSPCTPKRRPSSPSRTFCNQPLSNPTKAIGRRLIYDASEGGLNISCKDAAQSCGEISLKDSLPDHVEGASEHEECNPCPIKGKATRASINRNAGEFEQDNMSHSSATIICTSSGNSFERPSPATCKSLVRCSKETGDIPVISCSEFHSHALHCNSNHESQHGKSSSSIKGAQQISVARLLAKESASSSWNSSPCQFVNKKGGACETSSQQIGVHPQCHDKRLENFMGGGKDYVFCSTQSDPKGAAINLESATEIFTCKQGSMLCKEDSHEFLSRPVTLLNNSPIGRQVPKVQESRSVHLEERRQKRKSNVYDHEGVLWGGGQRENMDAGCSKETRKSLFIRSGADDRVRRSSSKSGNLPQVGTQEKRLKDDADEVAPQLTPGNYGSCFEKNSEFLYERESSGCLQHEGGKKIRGNLQRKSKGPQKFLRGRGSLGRKMAFRESFKYFSSLESCLRAQISDGNNRDGSLLRGISRSFLLQPLLYSGKSYVEHDNKAVEEFHTMESSIGNASIDVKGTGTETTDRSASSVLTGGQSREADTVTRQVPLESKMKGDVSTPTNPCREVKESGTDTLKPGMLHPSLDWSADDAFLRKEIVPLLLRNRAAPESPLGSGGEILFTCGVGVGVMFMISTSKREIEKMGRILKETEDLVHDMRKELDSRKARVIQTSVRVKSEDKDLPSNSRLLRAQDSVKREPKIVHAEDDIVNILDEDFSEDDDSARSVLTEEHIQEDCHMSVLEAELEAELERMELNMHSGGSSKQQGRYSAFMEMDPDDVADLADGELSASGLPAESESEDDKVYSVHEEVDVNNCAVSATELERRLWKVLKQRQDEQIMELERALEMTKEKLHVKEKELQWWKDRVRWLTELSFAATSGEDSLRNSFEGGSVSFGNSEKKKAWSSSLEGQEAVHFTFQSLENETDCCVKSSIEFVEKQSCAATEVGSKPMARVGSACSFSSEKSVISERLSCASKHPAYSGFMHPVSNCMQEFEELQSKKIFENPTPLSQVRCTDGGSNSGASSPSVCNYSEGASSPDVECKQTYDAAFSAWNPHPCVDGSDFRGKTVHEESCHGSQDDISEARSCIEMEQPGVFYMLSSQCPDQRGGVQVGENSPEELFDPPYMNGTVLQAPLPFGKDTHLGASLTVLEKICHWEESTRDGILDVDPRDTLQDEMRISTAKTAPSPLDMLSGSPGSGR